MNILCNYIKPKRSSDRTRSLGERCRYTALPNQTVCRYHTPEGIEEMEGRARQREIELIAERKAVLNEELLILENNKNKLTTDITEMNCKIDKATTTFHAIAQRLVLLEGWRGQSAELQAKAHAMLLVGVKSPDNLAWAQALLAAAKELRECAGVNGTCVEHEYPDGSPDE